MLRRMSIRQFREWQAYAVIEPFGEIRADYRAASISATIANVNRDAKKHARPFQISDFLLRFGTEMRGRQTQTWQQQKAIAKMIVNAANAAEARKKR